MKQTNILEILEFSDPVCTWCWASEPVLRALKARYAQQLDISFIMGGLVKDIRDFEDIDNEIGGDPSASNKQIREHWLEASLHHGMPVTTGALELFSDEHPSSYPQNIAYKAAQFEDQELADKFLRRLREATAVEAKQTNQEEVLLALAKGIGLDTKQLLTHCTDGTAETAFAMDLALTKAYKVRLLPTFILRYKGKEVVLENYQSVDTFEQAIQHLCRGELTARGQSASSDTILAFIRTYGRVVPIEIMMAFGLDMQKTMQYVHALHEKDLVILQKAGNGIFIDAQV
ncbi:MAG: DsbA family protein [Spirochaetia bacterium]|nr:DsbA family protein [Spirochaetia bacterium]